MLFRDPDKANRRIWAGNVVLALGIFALAIVFVSFPPGEAIEEDDDAPADAGGQPVAAAPRFPQLEEFRNIWTFWEEEPGTEERFVEILTKLIQIDGILVDRQDPSGSCAYLELLQTKEARNAYVGDSIAGAKVLKIEPNQVTFAYGKEEVVLALHRDEDLGLREGAASKGGVSGGDWGEQGFNTRPDPSRPDSAWIVDSREREWVLANDESVLNSVTLRPYRGAEGKMGGVIVDRMEPGSLVAARGIRQGDIVKSVNGQTIDSFERARELFQDPELSKHKVIRFQVERLGADVTLEYRIE